MEGSRGERSRTGTHKSEGWLRGNHLSNTTCLTLVFYDVADYGDPGHDEERIKHMRPH